MSLYMFYDFKTEVHLVGFYSILWMMMHGTMNVKKKYAHVRISFPSRFCKFVFFRTPSQYPVYQQDTLLALGTAYCCDCTQSDTNPIACRFVTIKLLM
jgi:hypothetical protein